MMAHAKYWAWQGVTKVMLGIVYISLISEGLRAMVPALGTRIWRAIPLLRFMRGYENFHRLDLSPIMAIFILIAVWYLYEKLLKVLLHPDQAVASEGHNPRPYLLLLLTLGGIILSADAILFYASLVQVGWRGTAFSFSAVLVTISYVAILVFVSFVSLNLHRELKKESV